LKVLFVSSANFNGSPSPIVSSQGKSLQNVGIEIEHFAIRRKGFIGYILESFRLRNFLRISDYDILHAHYGISALGTLLARREEKLVVSFMGDDLIGSNSKDGRVTNRSILLAKFNSFIARWFYDYSIVKSKEMFLFLRPFKASIIPNGVDISIFKPVNKSKARDVLGLGSVEQIVIFVSDISRSEKNYKLAYEAVKLVANQKIKLIPVSDVSQNRLPNYYNAADVLLLTSYHEGSPNVIKEAMACNCPIVSTDVGDVKWVLGDTEGCYIASLDPEDYAEKIKLALEFSSKKGRTNGCNRIIKLGLDSETIAQKIIEVYRKVLN